MTKGNFREKIGRGPVYGLFHWLDSPWAVEIIGLTGFDFVVIDAEHGPYGLESAGRLLQAAEGTGLFPIVRVPSNRPETVGRALDLGAPAVMIPQVNTADEARRAVELSRYFPLGKRGLAPGVRASRWGTVDKEQYILEESREVMVIVQIEDLMAVQNLPEILAVEGVDMAFIGPADLSQSMGKPGQMSDPGVVAEVEKVISECRERGILSGIFCPPAEAPAWKEKGVDLIAIGADSITLVGGLRADREKAGPE